MIIRFSELFYGMIVLHFLLDYPLQGDFIGKFKNRHVNNNMGIPWWHLMTAHAFIHGGGVALITGSCELGLLETMLHWLIDYMKCEGWTDINVDQALHLSCKVGYAILIVRGF